MTSSDEYGIELESSEERINMPRTATKMTGTANAFKNMDKLQDKINKATGIASVNMNPAPKPPVVEPEPKAPDITSLIADTEECQALCQLISYHATLTQQLKPLDDAREACSKRIKALISGYGIEAATYQGIALAYYKTTRKTLNQIKLMEAGVSVQIISACTDITESHSLKITPAKG